MIQKLKKITLIAALCIAILFENSVTVHAAEPRALACPICGGRVTENTRDDLLIIITYDCTDSNHAENCEVNEYYDSKYVDYVCETNGCPTTRQEFIKTFLYATHSNPK